MEDQPHRDVLPTIYNTDNNIIINLDSLGSSSNGLIKGFPGFHIDSKVKLEGKLEIRSTVPNLWFRIHDVQLKLKTDQEVSTYDKDGKLLRKVSHSTSPFHRENIVTRFKTEENQFSKLYSPKDSTTKLTGVDIPFSYTIYDSMGVLPSTLWEWYEKSGNKNVYSIRNYLMVQMTYSMMKTTKYGGRMIMKDDQDSFSTLEQFSKLKLFEIPIVFYNLMGNSPNVSEIVNKVESHRDSEILANFGFQDHRRIIAPQGDSLTLLIDISPLNSQRLSIVELHCSLRQIISTDDGKAPVISILDERNLGEMDRILENDFHTSVELQLNKAKFRQNHNRYSGVDQMAGSTKVIETQAHPVGSYLSVPFGPGREICSFDKSVGINRVLVAVRHEVVVEVVLRKRNKENEIVSHIFMMKNTSFDTIKKRYTIQVIKSNIGITETQEIQSQLALVGVNKHGQSARHGEEGRIQFYPYRG